MNFITQKQENVGKCFSFTNRYPFNEGVILENLVCSNETLGTEHLYKIFYITSQNKPHIRYVPVNDITVLDENSKITEKEIDLRLKYRWEIEDTEDYWYNFVNYSHMKV